MMKERKGMFDEKEFCPTWTTHKGGNRVRKNAHMKYCSQLQSERERGEWNAKLNRNSSTTLVTTSSVLRNDHCLCVCVYIFQKYLRVIKYPVPEITPNYFSYSLYIAIAAIMYHILIPFVSLRMV